MRSESWAISGPGSSDSIICSPPTRSRGSTAIARTMIPMPPSHWLNWRHIPSDPLISLRSDATLAPVVVKPDIPSKYASIGLPSCELPDKTYGRAAKPAASSQVAETTRKPSRRPTRTEAPAVSRSSAKPTPLVIAPAARNGQKGSSYQRAKGTGKSAARPRYLPSVPMRLSAAATSIASRRGGPIRATG